MLIYESKKSFKAEVIHIKYIFVGPQENEKLAGKKLEEYYPLLKAIYSNSIVTIYSS